MNTKPSKKGVYTALIGTVIVLLCCFTPILVIAIGVVGMGALTPYLDYFLFPALGTMVVVTILAYRKYKLGCSSCSVDVLGNKKF